MARKKRLSGNPPIHVETDAETEKTKRDKEAAKLRSRLQKSHEELQAQTNRANSLESDNVQLKVRLEEATKALATWKVKTKAEITNLAGSLRKMDEALNPRYCRTDSKAAPGVTAHVEKQDLLQLARKELRSVTETVMADSKVSDSDPVQQELRKIVKDELGLIGVENLNGKVYTATPEPQGQSAVVQRQGVGYPAFGDADIADRIRLRNLLDTIQAYFALKSNLHVHEGLEHCTVVNLSLLWRQELALVQDIPSVRIQKARALLAGSDLDADARNILENTAAMEIVCSRFSKYRTRGNEIHEPLDPAMYEMSIRRYLFHHPGDPTKPQLAALLAMISVPPLLRRQLSAQAASHAPSPPARPHHRHNHSI